MIRSSRAVTATLRESGEPYLLSGEYDDNRETAEALQADGQSSGGFP